MLGLVITGGEEAAWWTTLVFVALVLVLPLAVGIAWRLRDRRRDDRTREGRPH